MIAWALLCLPVFASNDRPQMDIPRLPRAPELEEFLDMEPPADLSLGRITGFVQREPEDGEPASQRTHVYGGYDDKQLYFVFVAFDDEPDKMRAHVNRRENIFGDETVEVQLDTFHDQRRAFSFLANPYGIQWDAIWTEGGGFDMSWDTVWQARGKITDRGYVVLMSIPFKSLRFTADEVQTWGLVFVRDIPRNNEVSFWPAVSSRIEGRLNQAGTLEGIENISPGRNIWVIPYGTARNTRILDRETSEFETDDFDGDVGVDAKLVFKDRLALDLTVNPDFSQVESDSPQVTVNQRFEVFFPEKRPFFLENANYFQTPINLLFTRRIADPLGGARATGKLGKYAVGALVIDDEAPGKRADSPFDGDKALFSVARISRDVGQQSNIGFLYTDRAIENNRNQVGGIDGRFKLNDNWDTKFQGVFSATDNEVDEGSGTGKFDDWAFSVQFDRSGRKFGSHTHYVDVGRDFRTEAGFVPRTDIRDMHQRLAYTFRPEGERLVSWGPRFFVQRIEDQSGLRLDQRFETEVEFNYRRQTQLQFEFETGKERLRPEDFTQLDEPRDYDIDHFEVEFDSRFVDAVDVGIELSGGRGINFAPAAGEPEPADRFGMRVDLTLRPVARLLVDTTYFLTRLDDRASGDRIFRDDIVRARVNYQFNKQFSMRAILQYENLDVNELLTTAEQRERFNGDLLLTYLINPWTAAYVGYNGNYENLMRNPGSEPTRTNGEDLLNDARGLFVKLSYLFRL
ncbi:MAG: carbohydrate binding family 9 domain-containing protein [bacterium]|nr:carbohydrate binding family 9 domain-containing protein [bacterium]